MRSWLRKLRTSIGPGWLDRWLCWLGWHFRMLPGAWCERCHCCDSAEHCACLPGWPCSLSAATDPQPRNVPADYGAGGRLIAMINAHVQALEASSGLAERELDLVPRADADLSLFGATSAGGGLVAAAVLRVLRPRKEGPDVAG